MTPPGPDVLDLFAPGAAIDGAGHLVVGGCDLAALADEFGTPAYVVDQGALVDRADEYRRGLVARWDGPTMAMFASKSFPCTAVYRTFAGAGIGCDVASAGELHLALRAGFDPSDVLVHGNAKSDLDVAAALEAGVGWIVVDNGDDIDRIESMASKRQQVLVRVRPGVDAPTHEANATGGDDSKFGLGLEEAAAAIDRMRRSPRFGVDGLHVHIGSQILDAAPFASAVDAVASLGAFDTYDLGGGLGVRYHRGDPELAIGDYLDSLLGAARRHLPPGSRILVEPGRSLVARAGCSVYRVQTVKRAAGHRTIVAVNGGMSDNLEVSLYGTQFEAVLANRMVGVAEWCRLVGHHCESGDRLSDQVALPAPAVGDVLAVPVTGAYCFTMANNYNASLRSPVVFVRGGRAWQVVRRETLDDLTTRDCG